MKGIPANFTVPWGTTGNGAPLLPSAGGPGDFLDLPYQRAPIADISPAGEGPIEAGGFGFSRAFYTMPFPAGRNSWTDLEGQGQKDITFAAGVQGLSGSVKRVFGWRPA